MGEIPRGCLRQTTAAFLRLVRWNNCHSITSTSAPAKASKSAPASVPTTAPRLLEIAVFFKELLLYFGYLHVPYRVAGFSSDFKWKLWAILALLTSLQHFVMKYAKHSVIGRSPHGSRGRIACGRNAAPFLAKRPCLKDLQVFLGPVARRLRQWKSIRQRDANATTMMPGSIQGPLERCFGPPQLLVFGNIGNSGDFAGFRLGTCLKLGY